MCSLSTAGIISASNSRPGNHRGQPIAWHHLGVQQQWAQIALARFARSVE